MLPAAHLFPLRLMAPVSAQADVSAASVKGAIAPGRSQNRCLKRGKKA
jgi:hypothetical protein